MYEMDDFVFVGTLPAMKRFFEAQVRLAPFHSGTHSIHGDVVRKHLSWTVGPALGWPAWRCFPALPFQLPETAWPRIHPGTIGPWVDTLLKFIVPMRREVWLQMTWRGSPPFAEWASWSGLNDQNRLFFDHYEKLKRDREDFFLRRWPKLFGERGSGWLQRRLDYALEVPEEMRLGKATRRTVFMRRARRWINRRRFRSPNNQAASSLAGGASIKHANSKRSRHHPRPRTVEAAAPQESGFAGREASVGLGLPGGAPGQANQSTGGFVRRRRDSRRGSRVRRSPAAVRAGRELAADDSPAIDYVRHALGDGSSGTASRRSTWW